MFELLREGLVHVPGRAEAAQLALLRAAMEEFGLRSLEGARTREIARKSGQNVAAIAYYFGSKEGLYEAVAEVTTRGLGARLKPVLDAVDGVLERHAAGGVGQDELEGTILRLCEPMMMSLLGDEEMAPLSLILMREQMRPTGVFDIFYKRVMEPVHRRLTALVAAVCGIGAETEEAVILAHGIVGQVMVFRNARETLRRRAKWRSFGERERKLVFEGIRRSITATMRGHAGRA